MAYLWQTHLDANARTFDAAYHDNPRSEILPFISRAPRRFLDVGCAGGATARMVRSKYPQSVAFGLEVNPDAAEHARLGLDHVVCGSIEDLDLIGAGFRENSIDMVFMLDVLEHLYNPWKALQNLRPLLTRDAQVIACIPNAFNVCIFERLSGGSWKYDRDGLFDITHIRFFTQSDMRAMFGETGYSVERCEGIRLPPDLVPASMRIGANFIDTDHVSVKNLAAERIQELFCAQFVVVAQPRDLDDTMRLTPGAPTGAGAGYALKF